MPVTPMKEILKDARDKKYAVGCYNAYDLKIVRGIIAAAESEKAPVILCHVPAHFKNTPIDSVSHLMAYEASTAKVPVSLMLDHGYDAKTYIMSMELGFNAVMIDASSCSFEENASLVKQVDEIATVDSSAFYNRSAWKIGC